MSGPDEFAHYGGADDASPPKYEDAHRRSIPSSATVNRDPGRHDQEFPSRN